jgi:hypothetical protein
LLYELRNHLDILKTVGGVFAVYNLLAANPIRLLIAHPHQNALATTIMNYRIIAVNSLLQTAIPPLNDIDCNGVAGSSLLQTAIPPLNDIDCNGVAGNSLIQTAIPSHHY